MKKRIAAMLLGGLLLSATGCLHPPFGPLNDNTTSLPPLGKLTHRNNLPPAHMLYGPGPGVDGPGPGVMIAGGAAGPGEGGSGCLGADGLDQQTVQVAFTGPDGVQVNWDVGQAGAFDSEPLVAPGRQNFPQAAIYRLRFSELPDQPGVTLYPTLEIGPATPRSEAYLSHNAIPIQLLDEDIQQILSGNFVTKVLYLPDPEFQELAIAGVETLVSSRLDPGVDPIVEADRRGTILAILRVGNKSLERADAEMAGGPLPCGPAGAACGGGVGPGGVFGANWPPAFVAGMTAPQYGLTRSGTPIGLAGPPHLPYGAPAGLKKHVIANHTRSHIPDPVDNVRIDVTQEPGFSYPRPVNRVSIHERAHVPPVLFHQPKSDKREHYNDYPETGYPPPGTYPGLQRLHAPPPEDCPE